LQKVQIAKRIEEAATPPWAHLRIPPFPRIAIQVLQLTSNADVPMRQLSDLICKDAAFSSEVLTIVNSAFYTRRSPVTSILQAIAVLGTDSLKGVCLTVGVRAYLGESLHHESLRAIWRHSLATALIAEQIAAATSMSKDTAYTAGVLHDIGRLALAVVRPKVYADLLITHRGSPHSILDCERELYGFDHCEAGCHLIADWKLPSDFASIVSDHHSPLQVDSLWRMPDTVRLSCRMADTAGFAVFAGCEFSSYEDLLQQIPERERKNLWANFERFVFDVSSKINSLEMV
jgi:putative nucleotidyltransferase with HDIG domain